MSLARQCKWLYGGDKSSSEAGMVTAGRALIVLFSARALAVVGDCWEIAVDCCLLKCFISYDILYCNWHAFPLQIVWILGNTVPPSVLPVLLGWGKKASSCLGNRDFLVCFFYHLWLIFLSVKAIPYKDSWISSRRLMKYKVILLLV